MKINENKYGLAQIDKQLLNNIDIVHFDNNYQYRDLLNEKDNLITLFEILCHGKQKFQLNLNENSDIIELLYWYLINNNNNLNNDKYLNDYINKILNYGKQLEFIGTPLKTINIKDNNYIITVQTNKNYIKDIFKQHNIILRKNDKINLPLDCIVEDGALIVIDRAKKITIETKDKISIEYTQEKNIGDLLKSLSILTNNNDIIIPDRNTLITEDMCITITYVDELISYETEEIPFRKEIQEDNTLYIGSSRVLQEGQNGSQLKKIVKKFKNNQLIETMEIPIEITPPINEIVAKGTKEKFVYRIGARESSIPTNYYKKMTFTATAYTTPMRNGVHSGRTSRGHIPRYGIIAVDPRVIPYGTKMYIVSSDGVYNYGYCIAGDCGGAIKGNIVDLFFDTHSECIQFGRRQIDIYFLNE